jgi:hypothetical protein
LLLKASLQIRATHQRGTAGHQRAVSGPRPLLMMPAKLLINLLLVTTRSFISFNMKDIKRMVIVISSAVLRKNATQAVDFRILLTF